MISRLKGTLLSREPDRVEIETRGGVVYEVQVPTSVSQRLPALGADLEILTCHVVREDSATLYGFVESEERELFKRLMDAKGVGAKKAVDMLSTFSVARLARALTEKDVTALTQVSGIGKKTAERIVVDLSDKVQDLAVAPSAGDGDGTGPAREAVSALVSLGFSFSEADDMVQKALEDGGVESSEALIRKALAGR
ncbi:MAG: Holliday junction branch migration protein RuvA [Longimicrobiales bacterium]|nr:Holliday junction branch migration protein RuvA [Longimicrobiales bacterium]